VSQRLSPHIQPQPRPVNTQWSNFNLSPPSTSVIGTTNTTPAIHYSQPINTNDYNDVFGKIKYLLELILIF
jgi:hypothetical protein